MKMQWITAALVLTGSLAFADAPPAGRAPTTGPSAFRADASIGPKPTTRPTPFGNRIVRLRDLGLTGPDWPTANSDRPSGPDEWNEVIEFGKTNFPNRWALFEKLQKERGDDNPLVDSLRKRFVGRYRLLKRIEGPMPDLYEAAVRQGRLDDEAWQSVIAFRKKRDDAGLNDAMRQKVSALVKNLLDERQERLKVLQQTLADEQKALDADRDSVEDLVDRQIARLSGDDPGLERMRGSYGGFGPGWQGRGWGRDFNRGPGGPRSQTPATQPTPER